MVENNYIDTSIQKAGIPGFSRCIEHTSVISQLIKEAKKGKKNCAAVWLDLSNAYESVPHQLIESAMSYTIYIPEKVQGIVRSYFGGSRSMTTPLPGKD